MLETVQTKTCSGIFFSIFAVVVKYGKHSLTVSLHKFPLRARESSLMSSVCGDETNLIAKISGRKIFRASVDGMKRVTSRRQSPCVIIFDATADVNNI